MYRKYQVLLTSVESSEFWLVQAPEIARNLRFRWHSLHITILSYNGQKVNFETNESRSTAVSLTDQSTFLLSNVSPEISKRKKIRNKVLHEDAAVF